MPQNLGLLRWFVTKPGRPQYRAAEEIVREAIVPAVQSLEALSELESLYVSKHCGREVWLTAFVPLNRTIPGINAVEPHLRSVCFRAEHVDDSAQDQILGSSCDAFRGCVYQMTRIGLELHAAPQFNQIQRQLVHIGCRKRDDRAALEPVLLANSTIYSAFANHDAFWKGFESNCLAGQSTDCGHWLYNLVLGIDWFQGRPEQEIFAELGL